MINALGGLVMEPERSSTVFYVLLGICLVLVLIHLWQQTLRAVKMAKKLPGPTPIPIFGNIHEALMLGPSEMMEKALKIQRENSSEDVIRIFIGHKILVGLFNPVDIEIILNSNVHLEKSEEYGLFQPWLGEGLLISKGEKWRSHRKMIAPTFHMSILKSFMPVFNAKSRHVVKKLRKEIGQEFDIHDYMSGITVDILLETVMGIQRNDSGNETGFDYAMAVMKMCNILHTRHYKVWLRPDIIFRFTKMAIEQTQLLNIIHTLTRSVIKHKKIEYFDRAKEGKQSIYGEILKQNQNEKTMAQEEAIRISGYNNGTAIRDDLDDNDENDIGEKKRLAFLDFMIEAGQTEGYNISDEEIKEEVDTIMFEGHDTTAAGSSFVLCLLAAHQDIQDKVYEEITEIFGESDRDCTFTDTLQMKYLERVIMESLRLYPPVPIIARKINQDIKLASGDYVLPSGCSVVIGTYLLHRRADIYPNPEVFDPDRFLPENCQNRHHYSYIPFSAGPRSCVGRKYAMLKLKVLLSTIVRNFRVVSDYKEKDFKLQADIILKRANGFRIKLEERNLKNRKNYFEKQDTFDSINMKYAERSRQ